MAKNIFPGVKIVGLFFRQKEGIPAYEWAEGVSIDDQLEFEPEPDNPFDANAIKIVASGAHVGYIERGQAAFIATVLEEGVDLECIVTDIEPGRNHPEIFVEFRPPA